MSVEDIQGECEAVTDVSSELPGRSALHTGSIPARGRHASGPATVTPGSGLPVQATRPARASFGYRPELDGIRALAVFAVFASHVGWGRMVGGWIGVGIFFVLSGYLITSILMVEWQRTGAIALRSFYLKRLLRLYPALLVMLVGCALFAPVFGNGGTAKGYLFSAAATGLYFQDFIAGITGSAHGAFLHTWSLAVEEQFYMFWPPALILILRKRASVLVWALAGTAVSWILLLFTTRGRAGTVPATYALPHTRAGELLLGCALAAWLARDPSALNLVAVKRWLVPVSALGLLLLALVAGPAGESSLMPLQIPAVALLSAALITGLVSGYTGWIAQVLHWKPLVWLGGISYGIYLFHLPILDLVIKYGPGPWLGQVAAAVLLAVGFAALSYRFVEKPMLRLKSRV